jgi:serine/threonine protein kinase
MQSASLTSESSVYSAPDDGAEPERFEATSDGRYRVLGLLGSGGMGSVFEVEHTRLRRSFALKLLRAELGRDARLSQRFERETRTLAALESDYIVNIVDSGTLADGRPYFVMERLRGEDLRHLLERLPELPVARAVNLIIDACLGLQAAHAAGLVHRDLKPANLFVTSLDGAGERCKLLDFGVAKAADTEQTQPGALVGTARYMAPEQVSPDGALGPRTDVFALGVILYRCLTGKHPFESDSLERVLYNIVHTRPPAILRPGVPSELEATILRALGKSADERQSSALAFARELLPFANRVRELGPSTPWSVELPSTPQLPDGEATRDVTPAELVGSAPAVLPMAPASRGHWLGVTAAAALLVLASTSLGIWYGRSTQRASTAVALPAAPPLQAVASIELAPSAVAVAPPPPSPASSALGSSRPPRSPEKVQPPRAARVAPQPPATSRAQAPSWFNPQNPYGD